LSTCGEAEEEGCGECITSAWCLREDDTGEDSCEADPLGDNVEFRWGSAEAKIMSNNEMPVLTAAVVEGEAGAEPSTTFLSFADANKESRVAVAAGADG
jgi:hypothetical protein